MTIEWFTKTPGLPMSKEMDDGSVMSVIGSQTPSVVRLPARMGGAVVRVLSSSISHCLQCDWANCVHLQLEGSLGVCECGVCGYLWYRTGEGSHHGS